MYSYLITLLIGLLGGAGSAWYFLPKEVVTVETQKEVEVIRTETKWRDRIVTVTRTVTPEGTVTEVTRTEEKEGESRTDSEREATETATTTTPHSARYSVAVGYNTKYTELHDIYRPSPDRIQAELGYRVLGPIWGTVGGNREHISVGVRYEF